MQPGRDAAADDGINVAGKQLIVMASSVAPGDVLAGVVTRCSDHGAFVSLQSPDGGLHGAEGLIHISELSWAAVLTPEAVVPPGTVVRAVVLAADAARGRIELSLKRLEADPLTQTLDALLPIDGEGGGGDASTSGGRAAALAPASRLPSSRPSSDLHSHRAATRISPPALDLCARAAPARTRPAKNKEGENRQPHMFTIPQRKETPALRPSLNLTSQEKNASLFTAAARPPGRRTGT